MRFFRTDLTRGLDPASPSVVTVVEVLPEPAAGNAGGGCSPNHGSTTREARRERVDSQC